MNILRPLEDKNICVNYILYYKDDKNIDNKLYGEKFRDLVTKHYNYQKEIDNHQKEIIDHQKEINDLKKQYNDLKLSLDALVMHINYNACKA